MTEPTKDQIKQLWEWCGFRQSNIRGVWWYPAGGATREGLPSIDLNNLFKYAVPKVTSIELKTWACEPHASQATIWFDGETYSAAREAPALALFWAIWQVMEKKGQEK